MQQGVPKKILRPDTIGLIPPGGYTDNRRMSKKAMAWLKLEERKEGKRILHGSNGKERELPELPVIRVDGLCEETRTVYEFMGCYWHGHTSMPFRDVATLCGGDTLAERYEQAMARLERVTSAGYTVKVQWECEFDPRTGKGQWGNRGKSPPEDKGRFVRRKHRGHAPALEG
jgi:hypothetical protein